MPTVLSRRPGGGGGTGAGPAGPTGATGPTGAGGGGGSGVAEWTGPYTVTFEDIDADNFNAVVMTPVAGSWLLAGLVVVTTPWTVTTKLVLAVGPSDDLFTYTPDMAPDGGDNPGISGLTGGQMVPVNEPSEVVRFDTVTTNRVCLSVDDIPLAGSADIFLCFMTPAAP